MTGESLLMEVLPGWNRYIGRAFKCNLDEGMSPPAHYLITQIRTPCTMTELARKLRMSKQQMTKLADKVIDMGMAVRENDPEDRRIVRLKATAKADAYLKASEERTRSYFVELFERMDPDDERMFMEALGKMSEVFRHLNEKEMLCTGKEGD